MVKDVQIVVGLGFGDEGKGLTTDYLCLVKKDPIVIRFNGGHQAGHTVRTSTGSKHIFSCFGSGTLRNIPTFWSKYCTFSPDFFLQEFDSLDFRTRFYIDRNCPVTTHYDILYNRCKESSSVERRKGSCGLGFGATIDRSKHKALALKFEDLKSPYKTSGYLKEIKSYYRAKVNLETDFNFDSFEIENFDRYFLEDLEKINELILKSIIIPVREEEIFYNNSQWGSYLFEGAQGVLLDQNYGYKPHITKSNTTSKNALEILKSQKIKCNPEINLVTRCYQTRHGAGPFREDSGDFRLINTSSETNKENFFQGKLKRNFLDIDLINYALKCENNHSPKFSKNLILTCLDQLPSNIISYYNKNRMESCNYRKLHEEMSISFKNVKYSFSDCSEYLKELPNVIH